MIQFYSKIKSLTLFGVLYFACNTQVSAQCPTVSRCFPNGAGGFITYNFTPINITPTNAVIVPDEIPATDLIGSKVTATNVGCVTIGGIDKNIDIITTVYDVTPAAIIGNFNIPSFTLSATGTVQFLGKASRQYRFVTQYFETGTSTPINLNILQQVTDIDGDGDWNADNVRDDPRCNVALIQVNDDYASATGFTAFDTSAVTHIYTRTSGVNTFFHSSGANNSNYTGILGRAPVASSQSFLLAFTNTNTTEFGYAAGQYGGVTIDYTAQNLVVTSPCSILPLNWLNFTGVENNGNVNLNWKVSNELNVKSYQIERSTDGRTFIQIGELNYVHSNTGLDKNYQYTDLVANLNSTSIYYRIKQYDFDGKFSYSSIIVINLKKNKENYTIFPNPTYQKLFVNITSLKNEQAIVSVINSIGQVEIKQNIKIAQGNNSFTINEVEKLSKGIYTISIKLSDKVITEKLIKL